MHVERLHRRVTANFLCLLGIFPAKAASNSFRTVACMAHPRATRTIAMNSPSTPASNEQLQWLLALRKALGEQR